MSSGKYQDNTREYAKDDLLTMILYRLSYLDTPEEQEKTQPDGISHSKYFNEILKGKVNATWESENQAYNYITSFQMALSTYMPEMDILAGLTPAIFSEGTIREMAPDLADKVKTFWLNRNEEDLLEAYGEDGEDGDDVNYDDVYIPEFLQDDTPAELWLDVESEKHLQAAATELMYELGLMNDCLYTELSAAIKGRKSAVKAQEIQALKEAYLWVQTAIEDLGKVTPEKPYQIKTTGQEIQISPTHMQYTAALTLS